MNLFLCFCFLFRHRYIIVDTFLLPSFVEHTTHCVKCRTYNWLQTKTKQNVIDRMGKRKKKLCMNCPFLFITYYV